MRLALSFVAALTLVACQNAPADNAPDEVAQAESAIFEGTTYGEALTLTEITQVSAILDNPDQFLGERVLVEGMIVEVCETKGCWMDIASDREFEKIQIKVDDGVIVFPLTARGHAALAEGIVEELELTYEQALEEAQHHAEEMGEEFDPSTVPEGTQIIYRIRGLGVVVAD